MKRIVAIAAALAALLPAAPVAGARKAPAARTLQKITSQSGPGRFMRADAAEAPVWRAHVEKMYGWENGWQLTETYNTTYDSRGRAVVQDMTSGGWLTRTTYEYGESDLFTTRISQQGRNATSLANDERVQRTYDDRCPTVITRNDQYLWDNDSWSLPGNCYTRTITRDAAGNVTKVEIAVLFNGIYDPTIRLKINYGSDGRACKIEKEELGFDYNNMSYYWETTACYDNITWERTDGQIIDIDRLFYDNNRIASATFTDRDNEITMNATYDGDNYELHCSGVIYGEQAEQTQSFTMLENNGFEMTVHTDYTTEDDETVTEILHTTEKYDAYGLVLLIESTFSDGEGYEELDERLTGEVEYDATNGYPLTHTLQMFDYDTEEMVNYGRTVYEDYENVAGIADITIDADAPAELYNLQGIRVDNPAPGTIVVRRRGTATDKYIVR